MNVYNRLSLDNANSGFSRDAFGRQSMSEKRHATLDAKNTDTYQRNKKLREERGEDGKIRKYIEYFSLIRFSLIIKIFFRQWFSIKKSIRSISWNEKIF